MPAITDSNSTRNGSTAGDVHVTSESWTSDNDSNSLRNRSTAEDVNVTSESWTSETDSNSLRNESTAEDYSHSISHPWMSDPADSLKGDVHTTHDGAKL